MPVEIARNERVLRIALDRPEKRNALNVELCRELVAALEDADRDARIGAILLCGNGKSFCAGMDLAEAGSTEPRDLGEIHERLFTVNARFTKPIVAAVQGAALAGGTGLAANAHIVVAATDATFGLTEIRIGLWPFLIFRSVSLAVGERRAIELGLTGRIFPASEALDYGLVHRIVEPGELEAESAAMARDLSQLSATAVRGGLEYVREARGKTGPESGDIARRIREQVLRSPDFAEGVQAFRGKRAPIWPSILE